MQILLVNATTHETRRLVRWLTPFGLVSLAEGSQEVIERIDRGDNFDLLVVCSGEDVEETADFHLAVTARHADIARRLVYLTAEPLPPPIADDGAAIVISPVINTATLAKHLCPVGG